MEPIFVIDNVSKRYARPQMARQLSVPVLDGITLSLAAGEAVALVGASGSGKSTLARLIVGLLAPDSGSLVYRSRNGIDISPCGAPRALQRIFRRDVQMVFQDPFASLNPVHSVRRHLERSLLQRPDIPKRADLEPYVHALLESVGLTPSSVIVDKYPFALSGGQRQRVAIARALATEPRLLLLDEPTSMLDVSLRLGVLNLLRSLQQTRGMTMLIITHDLVSARYIADRVAVLSTGRIVEEGQTTAVLTNPQHPYTRALMAAATAPFAKEDIHEPANV